MNGHTGKGVEWTQDGVPISERFDDPYFSLQDGLAETQHVFLAGNDFPARFRDGIHIAELGFGTGLNLLATWDLWQQSGTGGKLSFTSFEAFPLSIPQMRTALHAFPQVQPLAERLLDGLSRDPTFFETDDLCFSLIGGDARETLPVWASQADAWFLDGFSPAKNPELWEPELLQAVANRTAVGGTLATYTAAGHVRRALQAAGFDIVRVPGFGRKRHMTKGVLR